MISRAVLALIPKRKRNCFAKMRLYVLGNVNVHVAPRRKRGGVDIGYLFDYRWLCFPIKRAFLPIGRDSIQIYISLSYLGGVLGRVRAINSQRRVLDVLNAAFLRVELYVYAPCKLLRVGFFHNKVGGCAKVDHTRFRYYHKGVRHRLIGLGILTDYGSALLLNNLGNERCGRSRGIIEILC